MQQLLPFDQFKFDAGSTSALTHSAGTLSPGIDNSLLISVLSLNNSNYSSIDSSFSVYDAHSHDANSVGLVFGYQIQTTSTSRTPTFTTTTSNTQYAIISFVLVPPLTSPPTLIAHTIAQSTNANSVTTGAINTTGATALFVLAAVDSSTAEVINDSAGNSWTARTDTGSGVNHVRLFYCIAPITSAAHTFTCTITSGKPSICAAAFSATGNFDVENGAGSNNPGNITPTNIIELVLTGLGTVNTSVSPLIPDSGYQLLDSAINTTNGKGIGFAYKIQGSKVPTTTTWNANDASRVTNITAFVQSSTVVLTETASDTLSLGDALSIDAPIPGVSLSDSLNLSDTVNLMYGLIISDGFTLADLFDFGLSLPLSISGDSLSLLDAVIFLIGVGIGKSDAFTVSDVLKIAAQTSRVLGDNILLSDFLVALITQLPSYSDNFNLSDSANLILSLGITQSDSLLLSDAVQLAISNVLTLVKSDSLNLSDSLIIDTPPPLDQYVRHWLNDVPR